MCLMCNSTFIEGLFMPRKIIKCGWTGKGNETIQATASGKLHILKCVWKLKMSC